MKRLPILLLVFPLVAADLTGFSMWTGTELKTHVNAVKLDDHKVGVDKLQTWDHRALWVIRREHPRQDAAPDAGPQSS